MKVLLTLKSLLIMIGLELAAVLLAFRLYLERDTPIHHRICHAHHALTARPRCKPNTSVGVSTLSRVLSIASGECVSA